MVTTRLRHYTEKQSSEAGAPNRQQSKRVKRKRPTQPSSPSSSSSFKCGDEHRDHVREMLVAALSRVVDEVGEEMRDEVKGCDVHGVAVLIESALFRKLGVFKPSERPRLLKEVPIRMNYRRIMFDIESSNNNLDVRRKLLLGQLTARDLITGHV